MGCPGSWSLGLPARYHVDLAHLRRPSSRFPHSPPPAPHPMHSFKNRLARVLHYPAHSLADTELPMTCVFPHIPCTCQPAHTLVYHSIHTLRLRPPISPHISPLKYRPPFPAALLQTQSALYPCPSLLLPIRYRCFRQSSAWDTKRTHGTRSARGLYEPTRPWIRTYHAAP